MDLAAFSEGPLAEAPLEKLPEDLGADGEGLLHLGEEGEGFAEETLSAERGDLVEAWFGGTEVFVGFE